MRASILVLCGLTLLSSSNASRAQSQSCSYQSMAGDYSSYIKRTCGAATTFIPANDPTNPDSIAYQAWLAAGNKPQAAAP